MSHRASSHRYFVMEAYVQILGGKVKNIEETIKKLIDVLTAVFVKLYREQNIRLQCSQSQSPNI